MLQLIGTMRRRFAQGDTYETSDIGTTRQLVDAAKRENVDHFILLSSVGAGRPVGAYLRAKAQAEAMVLNSGIPFTLVRPSAFDGKERRPPPGLQLFTRALGLDRFAPIQVETLARALVESAAHRAPLNAILEGRRILDLTTVGTSQNQVSR
nr:hypothetical protein Hi04_10k_c5202_00017 [uncultured bacterium]